MAVIDTDDNTALCNEALGLLGATAITNGGSSKNHGYCVTFFEKARDEILAAHKWNFAKKRAFALQTTDPLFGVSSLKKFSVPDDCIRMWRIADDDQAKWEVEGGNIVTSEGYTPSDYDDDEEDYLAGQYLSSDFSGAKLTYLVDEGFTSDDEETDLDSYCTSQTADLQVLKVEYVYQYTTPADWPVYVQTCFVYSLALKLTSPITGKEGRAKDIYQMLYGGKGIVSWIGQAKSWDGQEGGGARISTTRWINSRR